MKGIIISVLLIIFGLITIRASRSEAQAQSSYIPSNGSTLLRYCPAELSDVFPIICVNDGNGNCVE